MAKLHDYYKETVVKELAEKFEYKSIMQVPKIERLHLTWVWARRSTTRSFLKTQLLT